MPHAIAAVVVLSLLALWSLLAWVLHAGIGWAASHTDLVSAGATAATTFHLPLWLAVTLPEELVARINDALLSLAPVVEAAVQATPALASGASVVIGVVWAFGCVLLLLLAALLHGLIAFWRRKQAAHALQPVAVVNAR